MRTALISILLLTSVSAQAAQPWASILGRYTLGTTCEEGNDGLITLGNTRLKSHETICSIKKRVKDRDGFYVLMHCEAEGEPGIMHGTITPAGKGTVKFKITQFQDVEIADIEGTAKICR